MSSNVKPADFDQQVAATQAGALTSMRRLYAALGATLLTSNNTIDNPVVRDQMEDHLVAINNEACEVHGIVNELLQSLAAMAHLARTFQQQRDDVAYELHEALNRADCAESTAAANIYYRLRSNIEETFYCTPETADHFLHALWDANAPVDDAVAELLDRVANTIDEWE